jgi:hypothetical protein
MSPVGHRPVAIEARLDVDLPDGWWCLDLAAASLSDDVAALTEESARPDLVPSTMASATWLRNQGASVALFRPGNDAVPAAICGGVIVVDTVPGPELYAALDAEGEPVALGDLDGIPIISHVRREHDDHALPSPMLQITYFICAPSRCIVVIFVAPGFGYVKCVVDEVASVVSAARVVHSDGGCPV